MKRSTYYVERYYLQISVVIPTKNRRDHLEKCLKSLFEGVLLPNEVIVINACSTDGTEEIAGIYPLRLLTVREKNRQEGRNLGLIAAKNDIVVFLDDDVVVDKHALRHIASAYDAPNIGGVGGRVLPDGVSKDYWMPACNNVVGKVRKNGFVIGNFDIPLQRPTEADCMQGCFMSFRREALLRSGGFDENYESGFRGDDTDVCLAVKRLGYKIIYEPRAIVMHKALGRFFYGSNEWFYHYIRGSTYFYFKNIFPKAKHYLPLFFLHLFFPPRDYVKKSNVRISFTPSLAQKIIHGLIDGILLYSKAYKSGFPVPITNRTLERFSHKIIQKPAE